MKNKEKRFNLKKVKKKKKKLYQSTNADHILVESER